MKIWNETNEDVFNYFQWFDKHAVQCKYEELPQLGVLSVNCSNCAGTNARKEFLAVAANTYSNVFRNNGLLGEYNFYLFANAKRPASSSVVIKSRKLWKHLEKKWDITDFECNHELEFKTDNGDMIFSGIAAFGYSELEKAFAIVADNPKLYTIAANRQTERMQSESTKRVFEYSNIQQNGEIDYFNLIIEQCLNNDIVFRLGDSADEMEIAAIFKNEFLREFSQSV